MHASAATHRALTPAGIRCARLGGNFVAYKMDRAGNEKDPGAMTGS